MEAALAGRPVRFVAAPDYADGLSASLRAGLAAVPPSTAAALVVLGDMPLVTSATIDRLVDSYDPEEGRTIVAPTHAGQLGNPVLWDRRYFPAMMALTGDRRPSLLRQHAEAVAEIVVDDTVLRDFDTADSLLDLPG